MAENKNPLIDIPTIDVGGFAEVQEEAKIKPLPSDNDEKWLCEIQDWNLSVVENPESKVYKAPMLTFTCKIVDEDPEFDGRFIRTRPFFLQGKSMRYFIGDGESLVGFVELVEPSRTWDPKKGIRLYDSETQKSEYLDSFKGCKFLCKTAPGKDKEGKPTGYDEMTEVFSMS